MRDIIPNQYKICRWLKNWPHIFSIYGTVENLKGPGHENQLIRDHTKCCSSYGIFNAFFNCSNAAGCMLPMAELKDSPWRAAHVWRFSLTEVSSDNWLIGSEYFIWQSKEQIHHQIIHKSSSSKSKIHVLFIWIQNFQAYPQNVHLSFS